MSIKIEIEWFTLSEKIPKKEIKCLLKVKYPWEDFEKIIISSWWKKEKSFVGIRPSHVILWAELPEFK